jgi:Ca2+-binding EF-hand superfamily protein
MFSWKDIWNKVADAASGLFGLVTNPASSFLGWAWDRIKDFGNGLWFVLREATGTITHAMDTAVSAVTSPGGFFLVWAWDRFKDFGNGLWVIVREAYGAIVAHLDLFIAATTFPGGPFLIWVWDRVTELGKGMWFISRESATTVANAIGDIVTAFTDPAGRLLTWLFDRVKDFGNGIWFIIREATGGITDAVGDVTDKVDALPKAALDLALDHKDDILKAYLLGFPDALVLALPELFSKFGPDVLRALRVDGKDPQQFAGDVFDNILSSMTGTGRIEPEDAPGIIARSLGVATAFGLAAQVPGLVQGLIPTENPTATNYVAGFLGKFSGWDHLIEAGLGAAVALALKRPMEYHLNKRSLTNEPRPGDVSEFYARRFVDPATFDETMHRHGFPDDWGTVYKDAAYHPLKKFELKLIAESTNLPENQLTFFLENAGYRPEAVPLMVKALQDTALKTARSAWLTQARDHYKDGFIDLPAFRDVMDSLGIDPTEQDIWVMSAQAAYVNAVKTELLSAYRAAAGRDAMVDDELRAACAQLGLTSDKIEVEVVRAQAARLKKPVDETAAEQKAAVNKARATMTQAYSLQFRKGAIDEQTFLAALIFIGVPDVQAAAVVALAKAQALAVPTAAAVDTPEMAAARTLKDLQAAYVLQFQHDLIDAPTLESALEGTGMAPYEANAIVLREQARKTPSPVVANQRSEERVTLEVQNTLADAYATQYQQGFITADELETDLVAAGFDPRVARSKRLLEESKAYGLATKSRASTEASAASQLQTADETAAREAYRKGVITADALESQLVAVGLSSDLAHAIRQYEELHALPKPTAATTTA